MFTSGDCSSPLLLVAWNWWHFNLWQEQLFQGQLLGWVSWLKCCSLFQPSSAFSQYISKAFGSNYPLWCMYVCVISFSKSKLTECASARFPLWCIRVHSMAMCLHSDVLFACSNWNWEVGKLWGGVFDPKRVADRRARCSVALFCVLQCADWSKAHKHISSCLHSMIFYSYDIKMSGTGVERGLAHVCEPCGTADIRRRVHPKHICELFPCLWFGQISTSR